MVKVIAECSKNWLTKENVSIKEALNNAKKLAYAVKETGSDICKWQAHVSEDENLKRHPKRHSWIRLNETLTPVKGFWKPLKEFHDSIQLEMLVTPMSELAAIKVNDFVMRWKVASPDTLDFKLLSYLKSTGKEIILSSGMTSKDDQRKAKEFLETNYYMLHCISEYPLEVGKSSLLEMEFYDGLSDHTTSLITGALAMAYFPKFIEKHFTIQNWGKDASVSLDQNQMTEYVRNIREAELAYRMIERPTEIEKELLKEFFV